MHRKQASIILTKAQPVKTLVSSTYPQTSSKAIPATAEQVPRIRVKELKALLEAGEEVIIADARSRRSYEASHIAGAISMPSLPYFHNPSRRPLPCPR